MDKSSCGQDLELAFYSFHCILLFKTSAKPAQNQEGEEWNLNFWYDKLESNIAKGMDRRELENGAIFANILL